MSTPERIQHGLEHHARRRPDAPCTIDAEGGVTSYAAADERARGVAGALRARGIAPGDRVVILLGNSTAYLAALFGVLKADAVAVPLDPESSRGEVRRVADHCGAAALVSEPRLVRRLAPPAGLPCPVLTLGGERPDPARPLPPPRRPLDDPALVLYTSGSTGTPKGVVLSHRNVAANTRAILAYLRLGARDRGLAVLPFCYAYGASVLNTHLWAGASLVIERRTAFPQAVLETLSRHAVTGFSGVPSTFMLLLSRGAPEAFRFPALRYLTCAGGRLPDRFVDRLLAAFPGRDLYLMYGATEASARLSYLPPARLADKRGSIGLPIDGVCLEVRRRGRRVAAGVEGEIWASGPNVARGYWPLGPGDLLLRDGWYDTGDLGWYDEEGFFYLTGRASQLLKIAGHRVHPAEIESALCRHHAVAACAVVGRADEVLGERAEAFVVAARPGLEADELRRDLRRSLPWFKAPSAIHLVDALPLSGNGKVLRHLLSPPEEAPAARR